MSRTPRRLALVVTAIALFAALIGASAASAATVVNGGFETGTLEGWTLYASNPKVTWEVGQEMEPQPPPFEGTHYAFSAQKAPGTAILYQDIALAPDSSHQLQLGFAYESVAPIVLPAPNTLDTEGAIHNQQVRVDVMKPTAPITSVEPGDVLATVFASSEAENLEGVKSEPFLEPKLLTADLTQFAGQTVRLRIAVAVTDEELEAYVDNVSVTSTPLPPRVIPPSAPPAVAAAPTPPPPSNVFTKGKLTLNKKTGTATLAVSVPAAGILTATDVHSKVATASLAKSKPKAKPVLVRSATVDSTGAGTIAVPIKPTAAAKKILAKNGSLAVKVNLTFTPTGGSAAAQIYSGKLVKKLSRPGRG